MNILDSIIFDLDGTLWSTIESAEKCLAIVKSKHQDILQEFHLALRLMDLEKSQNMTYKLNDIADLLTIVYDKQKGGNDFAER